MVKIIRLKAASPPHTDSSVVFARLHQCDPFQTHQSAFAPCRCWPLLCRRTCPGPAPFRS